MKQIILTCMLSAGVLYASAQTSSESQGAATEESTVSSDNNINTVANNDAFAGTTIAMRNKTLAFSNLPNMPLRAVVTNQDGEIVKSKKVSAESNTMEMGGLTNGMYFITLFNKNKSKKGFVIHI